MVTMEIFATKKHLLRNMFFCNKKIRCTQQKVLRTTLVKADAVHSIVCQKTDLVTRVVLIAFGHAKNGILAHFGVCVAQAYKTQKGRQVAPS